MSTLAGSLTLEERYRHALSAYVHHKDDEAQLIAALELGRLILAEGRSLLDLLSIHFASIIALVGESSRDIDIASRLAGANEFLTQVAAPFEMALLSWHEMADRLRTENEALERQVSERIAAHREVKEHLDRTQQDLLMSEARWRSVVENPFIGISFLDEDQHFIATNQAFQNMIGYTGNELREITAFDLGVSGEREIDSFLFRQLQQGKREYYEVVKPLRRKDGQEIWIQLYVFAVRDSATGALSTFGMMLDVTESKRAQDALMEARAEITRVARVNRMGAMTASIAHEINQPLGAMVANANAGLRWLARDIPEVDRTRAILHKIVGEGHRAAETIKSVRALFKAQQQPRDFIDLNELIRDVLSLADDQLRKYVVEVSTFLSPAVPRVMADRVQMQQVIFNLITNAIDAMEAVTDRDRLLQIKTEIAESGEVRIVVADAGVGIEPEKIDKLFNTFFTTKVHGLGLGLAICRSIIESHGGHLWASHGDPHGAVFQFVLPLGEAKPNE